MKYNDIRCYEPVNEVDDGKVGELVKSMLENGWQGMPILVCGEALLTGSHRLAALRKIDRMIMDDEIEDAAVLEEDIADDVTEIVENKLREFEAENDYVPDIDYADIGWLLAGSWVEEYKDEIVEW